jgi:hypothetical protein
MTNVSLDLDAIVSHLNGDLTQALRIHSPALARERLAVAKFLARECDLLPVKQVAARARAVAKFLEVSRHA